MEKNFKKVVWPNVGNRSRQNQNNQEEEQHLHHHHQETFASNNATDRPMAWMKNVASTEDHHAQSTAEAMEMEIQKRVWDATTGRHLSRSRSKSKNIMDRARSFERAAEAVGSAHSSRAPSRQGSSSNIPQQHQVGQGGRGPSHRRTRSPSAGRQMADFWQTEANSQSRPQSRAGRERSVGRVDTSHWEAAMAKAKKQGPPPKTPPQRRRELKAPSPAPPPPPPQTAPMPPPRAIATTAAPVVLEDRGRPDHESTPPPPPPPPLPQESELKSIQSLSQEEKEQIVEQWVQQTSTQQQAQDELEKFAYEIAETVVSTMEKHQVKFSTIS